jgi:hypothetical protein
MPLSESLQTQKPVLDAIKRKIHSHFLHKKHFIINVAAQMLSCEDEGHCPAHKAQQQLASYTVQNI